MMIGSSWTGTGLREARAQLQEGTFNLNEI